jgi:putative ABC transport system substrate-binding protein
VRPGAISRRQFVLGTGATSLGLLTGCGRLPWQEAPAKVPRLGILAQSTSETQTFLERFRQGLRDYGYTEGQNLVLEFRWADGVPERLPELAVELVEARVDVIVAAPPASTAHAAKNATSQIPIVMLGAANPVRNGLVDSLARPGGNVTGLSADAAPQVHEKRLELLTAAVPGMSRVAILQNPAEPGQDEAIAAASKAARVLGVELQIVPARDPDELDSAFDAIVRNQTEAILSLTASLLFQYRSRITALAVQRHLPTMFSNRDYVVAGGLMAYGPNPGERNRHAAYFVDRILRGAKPADLPVEQPMTFDFVVNLKTARELGIIFPNEIMLQVTEVIDQ